MKTQKTPTTMASVLAVLGEPVRLRLLRLVEAQELAVGELARVLQMPQSTVSRHLKVLAEAGLVGRRSEGPASYFRLVPDELTPAVRSVWAAVRDQAAGERELAEDRERLAAVVAERRLDSREYFGRLGAEWTEVRRQLFGTDFTAPALLSMLPAGMRIADLGCGTGEVGEALAPVAAELVMVDQSDAMLGAARERLAGVADACPVRFIQSELESLPIEPESLDAAVLSLALHHVEDIGAAIDAAARCLREGGVLLVIDMVAHDRDEYRRLMGHKHLGFSPERITGELSRAGLRPAYRELPRRTDAKGPGLFVASGRKDRPTGSGMNQVRSVSKGV